MENHPAAARNAPAAAATGDSPAAAAMEGGPAAAAMEDGPAAVVPKAPTYWAIIEALQRISANWLASQEKEKLPHAGLVLVQLVGTWHKNLVILGCIPQCDALLSTVEPIAVHIKVSVSARHRKNVENWLAKIFGGQPPNAHAHADADVPYLRALLAKLRGQLERYTEANGNSYSPSADELDAAAAYLMRQMEIAISGAMRVEAPGLCGVLWGYAFRPRELGYSINCGELEARLSELTKGTEEAIRCLVHEESKQMLLREQMRERERLLLCARENLQALLECYGDEALYAHCARRKRPDDAAKTESA